MKKALALLLALVMCLSLCACSSGIALSDGDKIIVDGDYFNKYMKENSIFIELTPDNWKELFTFYEEEYEEKDEWGEVTTKTDVRIIPKFDSNCYWGLINPANLEKNAVFHISVNGQEQTVASLRALMRACQTEDGYSFENIEILKCSAELVIIPLREEWIGETDGKPTISIGSKGFYSTATGLYPSFEGSNNSTLTNFLREWLSEEK